MTSSNSFSGASCSYEKSSKLSYKLFIINLIKSPTSRFAVQEKFSSLFKDTTVYGSGVSTRAFPLILGRAVIGVSMAPALGSAAKHLQSRILLDGYRKYLHQLLKLDRNKRNMEHPPID